MKAVIDTRRPGPKIDRHLYGHFSEHLGRCIYGGYWVGEDSPIPNVRGIRTDIVEAMKAIHVPNIRWPGGCFADDYHWLPWCTYVEVDPTSRLFDTFGAYTIADAMKLDRSELEARNRIYDDYATFPETV